MTFGDMPDLCHRHPLVYAALIELAQWMVEIIGFDGFRFDFVKGYAPWMVQSIAVPTEHFAELLLAADERR